MLTINNHIISASVEDIIDNLKSVLAAKGIQRFYKTIDTPDNTMICCPFHKDGQEKKPSMGILKKDGTCHCFACGWVGSLSELISNVFGYDDFGRYGEKWLLKNYVSIEIENRQDIDLDLSRKKKTNKKKVDYVSEEELDTYRYTHPYWAKRGITDEYIIELFDLGFDAKTNCITFPIRDIEGRCLFVARRNVQTKFFNYPKGVEKPLYGLYELLVEQDKYSDVNIQAYYDEIIVCESMIDALTCWQYGKYAVALNGLGNDLQFKQLRDLPCRTLIIATDNDEAGMKARERISKNVKNKILKQYIFPEGKKDINDLSKEEFDNLTEIFL